MASILDSMAEGILLLTPDGTMLVANAAVRRLLGLPDDARPGACLWAHVQHDDLRNVIAQAFGSARPAGRELILSSPEERIVEAHVVVGHGEGAEPTAWVLLHDVTTLRRLERVRQDFIANVSHELRTPLTSIKGFIETLLQGAVDDPAHNRQFLTLVEEDVNRLARLTDDLLALSKVESLGRPRTRQAVDMLRVTHEVVESLMPQMRAKRITVSVAPPDGSAFITGDPDEIRQVLWNLLDNATKYNVEDGRITIRLLSAGEMLEVQVADTGIGMPEEELPRVFERFYRVDKARSRALGGTGLGLSIVKHIVEAHGGTVDVTSQLNHGSTFALTLPRAFPAS